MKRCTGGGGGWGEFPSQTGWELLGTKCAMESQFPTQTAATAVLVLKYEKLSGFTSSLFILSPLYSMILPFNTPGQKWREILEV